MTERTIFVRNIHTKEMIQIDNVALGTVLDLKKHIASKKAYPQDIIRLIFPKTELKDDTQLTAIPYVEDQKDLLIHLVLRFSFEEIGITMLDSNRKHMIPVNSTTTIMEIKQALHENHGCVSPGYQRLVLWNGRRMLNDSLLRDYHLTPDAKIVMITRSWEGE